MSDAKAKKKDADERFLAWVASLGDPGGSMLAAGHSYPPTSASAVKVARYMVGGPGARDTAVPELAAKLERFKQAVGGTSAKKATKKAPRKAS